jgi:4-oxalmesaconate hydratase
VQPHTAIGVLAAVSAVTGMLLPGAVGHELTADWPSDRATPPDTLLRNVFFDTCVYHQPGIDLLFDVIDVDSILFGSEMVGAVRGIDPRTGHHFDDTRRYVDALDLSPDDRAKVFEANARRVYPRLRSGR